MRSQVRTWLQRANKALNRPLLQTGRSTPDRSASLLPPSRLIRNRRGSALLMAMAALTLMIIIATEVSYDTVVEHHVTSQDVNQLKAYYAAKSGAELSLLRVHIYKKALAQFGDAIPDKSMLDPVWSIPFAWPPVLPDGLSGVDKDEIQKTVKASNLNAQFLATIESEGSKIDINDLASPSKAVAEHTRKQLEQLLQAAIDGEGRFAEDYRNFDFNRLFNNLTDWTDEDTESLNGGDEGQFYSDIRSDFIPPNQPFKTLDELHMVEGMTDDIFEILAPRITVFGTKGININYASKDVLMSLDPQITSEIADRILEGRNDPNRGPFKDLDDFVGFLGTLGFRGNPFVAEGQDPKKAPLPLVFDAEINFRIRSTGQSGKVTREIIAIVYDFDKVKSRLSTFMAAESQSGSPGGAPGNPGGTPPGGTTPPAGNAGNNSDPNKAKPPKGRPNVLYWDEA